MARFKIEMKELKLKTGGKIMFSVYDKGNLSFEFLHDSKNHGIEYAKKLATHRECQNFIENLNIEELTNTKNKLESKQDLDDFEKQAVKYLSDFIKEKENEQN